MHSEQQSEPKLAAPGAGVPFPQKLVMRLYLKPFVANRSVWEKNEENFRILHGKIKEKVAMLSKEQLEKPVLVPPQIGLEDSSRYWSISMTIDHITIVSRAIAQVVKLLDEGKIPQGKADPATVKPPRHRPWEEVQRDYETFASQEFPRLLPSLKNRSSPTKFHHPWFGKINARAWYWLLVNHQGLHYKQIKKILEGQQRMPNPAE